MNEITYNYNEEADVLYVSFGRSEHVTGVELLPNLIRGPGATLGGPLEDSREAAGPTGDSERSIAE